LEEELDDSEEVSEDEDGLLPDEVENQFKTLLPLIVKKDAKIYDKEVEFFEDGMNSFVL